jgi:hypothetical protein
LSHTVRSGEFSSLFGIAEDRLRKTANDLQRLGLQSAKGPTWVKRMNIRGFSGTVLLVLLTATAGLHESGAHHGGNGRYDASRPIYLRGTVVTATFAAPHAVMTIAVEAAEPPTLSENERADFRGDVMVRSEDVGVTRQIEFAPIGVFFSLSDRVSLGDRVEVIAMRNCDAPHQLRSQWIRLADGELVMRTGGRHRTVDGCS